MQSEEEDRLAGIALGKTVVVLLYGLLLPFLALPIMLWLEDQDLPPVLDEVLPCVVFCALLSVLIYLGVKGWLPASKIEVPFPFSERQLVAAVTILSLVGWLASTVIPASKYLVMVANGALFLGVVVFFVAKSCLAKKVRFGVLSGLLAPGAQLVLAVILKK